ncbi:hypothetical protein HPP92_014638 [Vanilla planifolia]|uniref:Uncharacterized protein n=1 Tax=Vanilla planifolia TaxID=51239 RepID=A0A835UUY3_VANPL|nr:hypothetical protein HPP92_014638 [Vanilla planifolia]
MNEEFKSFKTMLGMCEYSLLFLPILFWLRLYQPCETKSQHILIYLHVKWIAFAAWIEPLIKICCIYYIGQLTQLAAKTVHVAKNCIKVENDVENDVGMVVFHFCFFTLSYGAL